MNGSPVAGLVRGWVALYTRGMPAELRAARRDEIDDDLWCQLEEAAALGRPARSRDAEMGIRLLLGMPADLSWRLTYHKPETEADLERSSSMNTYNLGVLAIVGGLSYGILSILFVPIGEALWMGDFALLGMGVTLTGVIAFSAAAVGLASRFQDRIGPLGGVGAVATPIGALLSMGSIVAVLPVGSALLMWDLGRIGVISRLASIVHAAAAIILVVGSVTLRGDPGTIAERALLPALMGPYLVTWVAIGASLLRRVPQAGATSG
jgi:hypothetical protein